MQPHRTYGPTLGFLLLTLTLPLTLLPAVAPAADGPRGLADYLDGLDALEAANWPAAAAALDRAVQADEDNAGYYTARGVARTLGGRLREAATDLSRARRLKDRNEPARLWLAAVVAMQGDFTRDT